MNRVSNHPILLDILKESCIILSMEIPAKFSLVAYWVDPITDDELYRRRWSNMQHYILLGPTGPTAKSYFAVKSNLMDSRKQIRIQLVVPGVGILVNDKKYKELYANAAKIIEQKKLWNILTR